MKFYTLTFILSLLLYGPLLPAWKEVNNGAGISEQNLLYAKMNAEEILTPLTKILTIEEDLFYPKEWIQTLNKLHLEFSYKKHHRYPFLISGRNCLLYAENLYLYDTDQNNILSIKESYLLLFEIYAQMKYLKKETVQNIINQITPYLDALETTLIIHSGREQIQWTRLQSNYLVFFAETEPMVLNAPLFHERLCPEGFTHFELNNPTLLRLQKSSTEVNFLLRVDAYFTCQGLKSVKSLLLEFYASEKEPKLKLQ